MTAILEFASDGSGQCLHTDLIPLQELGRLSVRRASTVEFCETIQEWVVMLPNDNYAILFHDKSRQSCLDWESENAAELISYGNTHPLQTKPAPVAENETSRAQHDRRLSQSERKSRTRTRR